MTGSTKALSAPGGNRLSQDDPLVTFVRITGPESGRLTKSYRLVKDEVLREVAPPIGAGLIQRHAVPLSQLLMGLEHYQCHVYGQPRVMPGGQGVLGTRRRKAEDSVAEGVIARTRDEFFFPPGEAAVLFVDHDPRDGAVPPVPALSGEGLLECLIEVFPGFADAARLVVPSASAGIFRSDSGERVHDSRGLHVYFAVADASDIPRFGEVLFRRLWLAGFGSIDFSRVGSLLERTVIDRSVFQPERVDYAAPAVLGPGLARCAPSSVFTPGGYLDTHALADLSPEEEGVFCGLVAAARAGVGPRANSIRAAAVEASALRIAEARGVPLVAALATVEAAFGAGGTADLWGDFFPLVFSRFGEVSVADVFRNHAQFDGEALADPVEGVSYGATTAKLYLNEGKPVIHSFAHGAGSRYFLHCETAAVGEVVERGYPSVKERPCYRVFDDAWWVNGQSRRRGTWYFSTRSRGDAAPLPLDTWFCSPLHIEAQTSDLQARNVGRLLRFRTSLGDWREWAMGMSMLAGDGADLRRELLDRGVEIDPNERSRFLSYLTQAAPQRTIHCATSVGWFGNARTFVLPDSTIGHGAGDVIYQSLSHHAEYSLSGSLEGWRDGVSVLAVGNPLLMLGLCAAYAGPLLYLVKAESGGIHFVGNSSTGKTTIIHAATSVWGGADFKRSWRATSNGLEGAASLFSDSLLALDEVSECDPREVGAIVYALANGVGKQRATQSGQARAVVRWRCSVLSSGERTIATTMLLGGQQIKAGQAVRLLDVPVARLHGAWDVLHGMSGAGFSDAIQRASALHHGYAGRAFLERLTLDEKDFMAELERIKALPAFTSQDSGQDRRAAARFALLGLAGEVATGYGITGWPEGGALEAAAVGFEAWRSVRGHRGNAENPRIIEAVAGFLDRNGDSRFSRVSDASGVSVRDRAGWFEDTPDGRVFWFNPSAMREALHEFDFERALDVLVAVEALIPASGSKGERSHSRRLGGDRKSRYYKVVADRLEEVTL